VGGDFVFLRRLLHLAAAARDELLAASLVHDFLLLAARGGARELWIPIGCRIFWGAALEAESICDTRRAFCSAGSRGGETVLPSAVTMTSWEVHRTKVEGFSSIKSSALQLLGLGIDSWKSDARAASGRWWSTPRHVGGPRRF